MIRTVRSELIPPDHNLLRVQHHGDTILVIRADLTDKQLKDSLNALQRHAHAQKN